MSGCGGSIVATTYQAGKVAVVGWDGRRVTLLMRQFDKPLGLASSGGKMALATRHEIVLLADAPLLAHDYLEREPGRYDPLTRVGHRHTVDRRGWVIDQMVETGAITAARSSLSCSNSSAAVPCPAMTAGSS